MSSPGINPASSGWLLESGRRICTHWPLKMTGTMIGMGVFFVAYFWLLEHPIFPVTEMPLTALDRWIAFRPESLVPYMSLWIYVTLLPALLRTRRELAECAVAWVVLSAAGLGCFLFWPTAVPMRLLPGELPPEVAFLKAMDAAGNACPSLHVAFAVFSAVAFTRVLREIKAPEWVRVFNWMWCAGIGYSTVAIRQHVVIDVVAGAALGAVVAWGYARVGRARNR